MEVKAFEMDKMEFWPLQHPLEPDDEDHPVICPMPNSTSLLDVTTLFKYLSFSFIISFFEILNEFSFFLFLLVHS